MKKKKKYCATFRVYEDPGMVFGERPTDIGDCICIRKRPS